MKLINTTVFRMALRFAAVFATLSVGALLSVYFITLLEMKEQTDRELKYEMADLQANFLQQGIESFSSLINQRDQYGQFLHHFYAVVDNNNKLLAGNQVLLEHLSDKPVPREGMLLEDVRTHIDMDDDDDNMLRIARQKLSSDLQLVVAQTQKSRAELLEHTLSAVLMVVLVTILLSLAFGVYMSKKVLSHINLIDQGLQDAINSDFRKAISVPDQEDEFQALTLKLNLMLARISDLITGMRHVTDNVAHDLRSPLTRIRNRLEVTLLQPRTENEYREVMSKAVNDCGDLLKTFNALLSIAQAEAGVKRHDWNNVNLTTLLDELAEFYYALAEENQLTLHWQKPEKVIITGNQQLLAQTVSNLLENAIKYTPAKGKIEIRLREENKIAQLSICDTGPGVADEDKPRVLQRFQRLDNARTSPGNGLGLSLVQAVAKLHNASLELSDNRPGLCVNLNFPDVITNTEQ